MNKTQIARLMETEHQKPRRDIRRDYWHYRRTPATHYRDAVWQTTDRYAEGWHDIEMPPMDVLLRLERKGSVTVDHVTWQGFHDPARYEAGE